MARAAAVVVADLKRGWQLRPALPDEASALTEMALRSKASWGYDAAFMASCRAEMTVTPESISASEGRIVVALCGDQIQGYFDLVPVNSDACDLEAMFVDPDCMGEGVGTRLMEHALAMAKREGFRKMQIQADPFAEGFYQRFGATKVGELESGSIPGRFLPLYELALN
ncbi:MAG: GNAT family N-acetyltransferase [Lysobacterales bacterium]